jgi:hypothetical protein
MTQLLFLLPIISVILWIFLLYKWTSSFLKKWEDWYIYFRFLFSLIVIFLLIVWLMWLIIWTQTKILDITENIIVLSNVILVWLPVLWTSIWIWLLWKYLFDFILFVIKYWNKLNNTIRYLKMFLFMILTIILLIIIHIWIIYWLVMYFQMADFWIIIPNNLSLTNSLLLWLSWFGYSIWIPLLTWGMFIYLKKLLSKEKITLSKKVLYSIWSFLLFIVLYSIIQLWSLFALIVSFQLLSMDNLNVLSNLNIWLLLWLVSLVTWVIQWYSFLNYQRTNKNIYIPISVFIVSNISLVFALVYAFQIISSI